MNPASLFSALADPTRCRVIELLHDRPRPVHELAEAFDISRPAISRHLRVLKDARLVKEEKRGRENVYALQRPRLRPMQKWLEGHAAAAARKEAAKADAAEPTARPRAKPAGVAAPVPAQFDLFG